MSALVAHGMKVANHCYGRAHYCSYCMCCPCNYVYVAALLGEKWNRWLYRNWTSVYPWLK